MSAWLSAEGSPLDPAGLAGPVWVVSPHPDDEALGCGALLACLSQLGRPLNALLLSDGAASHPGSRAFSPGRLAQLRLAEWHAGLDALGARGRRVALGLPDGGLPGEGDRGWDAAVSAVRAALQPAPPATLLRPWRRDPHPDHRAGAALLTAALAELPPVRLLEYLVWLPQRGGGDEWPRPDEARRFSLQVGARRAAKERAVLAHRSQLGELIHDDPGGFTLPPEMVRRALDGPELYLEVNP